MDINTKKLKKNAYRVTKVRGITALRVRVPGGLITADFLGNSTRNCRYLWKWSSAYYNKTRF